MKDFKLAIVGQDCFHIKAGSGSEMHKNDKLVHVRTKAKSYGLDLYYKNYYACVLVNVTKDFDPESEELIEIEYDTDSYQVRPKLIYKDTKGYYYKPYGKVVRLTEGEEILLKEFVNMYRAKEST